MQNSTKDTNVKNNNFITDFPEQTPEAIEELFLQPLLVKEIPISLQLSNKKRKQQLKEQMRLRQKQHELELEEARKR